jgi:hydroxypyruvate reductase
MWNEAEEICLRAIDSCLPEEGVKEALKQISPEADLILVAVGKAAFSMTKAAIGEVKIKKGILITKYGHVPHPLEGIECLEAGHPLSDENTLSATQKAIDLVKDLKKEDTVLFLLSGGASALFEKPLIPLNELIALNDQMLKKGLSITQINTIRKKLSAVKGGRFADLCAPARVYGIILSDVLSDQIDVIGSGPTVKDTSSAEDALAIIENYDLELSENALEVIHNSQSGKADNAVNRITGSVSILCKNAAKEAENRGYEPILLNDHLDLECEEVAEYLKEAIRKYADGRKRALIAGGEPTVLVRGNGKGGRCQQLAYLLAKRISSRKDIRIVCIGSDGTDGPTDAAGAYVDGTTYEKIMEAGIDYDAVLQNNDTYHALDRIGSLIRTGATGTNVNDLFLILTGEENEKDV